VIATLSVWWLGHVPEQLEPKWITPLIIMIAYIKIRLVILHFMEIKTATWPLRLLLELWCFSISAILLTLLSQYLLAFP
jgi:hypothetical protein